MRQAPEVPVAELPAPRVISRWRGFAATIGVMTAVIVAVVLTIAISSSGPAPKSSIVAPGSSVRPAGAAAGNASAQFNRQIEHENHRQLSQAASSGDSFVPALVGNVEPVNPIQPAEGGRVGGGSGSGGPPAATIDLPPPTQSRPDRIVARNEEDGRQKEALRGEMDQYLTRLDQGWHLNAPVRQVGRLEDPSPSSPAERVGRVIPEVDSTAQTRLTNAAEPAAPTTIRVGDTLYASNEYEVNSDIGSVAVARVLAGELQGAKLKGRFKLSSDYLVLEYEQLVLADGAVLAIQAIAVDPVADRLFVRSAVDHHVLARWGGFLGSVYLATYGQKLEQSGETTVVSTGSGGTTTVTQQPQYSAKQINEIALGRMGAEVANELRKGLSRPPTVTLKAHAEVGVLILAAPSRAQQLRDVQTGG